jgi:hypothetical protein
MVSVLDDGLAEHAWYLPTGGGPVSVETELMLDVRPPPPQVAQVPWWRRVRARHVLLTLGALASVSFVLAAMITKMGFVEKRAVPVRPAATRERRLAGHTSSDAPLFQSKSLWTPELRERALREGIV